MINNNIFTNKMSSLWRFVILLAMLSITVQSFGQSNHEFSLYLEGSFSKLDYEVLQQKSRLENGFGFGARYGYYLSENWSIATGVGLQYLEGSIYLPAVEGAYQTRDLEGDEFEFRYRAGDFSENQHAYFLNVPLQIQYETSGATRFYAAAGVKAGIIVEAEYESKLASLTTSGYYPQYDVELTDPEFAGFGEFRAKNSTRSQLDLKTSYILNLESGVKFMLENEKSLYLGAFLDYGLNDIQPDASRERLIGYNSQYPVAFPFDSLLSSQRDMNSEKYINEVRTLAFGLKLQYGFQF